MLLKYFTICEGTIFFFMLIWLFVDLIFFHHKEHKEISLNS